MKTLTLNFHNDGGHGWVACKKDLVIALGIAGSISRYSYQRGGTAYLEEDCDMPILMRAIEAKGVRVVLRDKYRDESPIRGYQSFSL
jgi:hypothetical protein